MKPNRVSLAVGLVLGLSIVVALVAGCGRHVQASTLEVTYYYRPGCAVCARATPAILGLEREFPGRVRVQTVDATSPQGVLDVQRYNLDGHGMVIRSPRGFVLWTQPQHNVDMNDVRKQLTALLSAEKQASL